MKHILFYLFLIVPIIFSCKKNDNEPANEIYGTATIRIYEKEDAIAEFTDHEVVAIKDEEELRLNIASPDENHIIILSISKSIQGTFPIEFGNEENSSHLIYIWENFTQNSSSENGLLIMAEGEVVLENVTSQSCSGKIDVRGLPDENGLFYRITGEFNAPYFEI